MRLVLASRNAHKLRELQALLEPHELEPLPPAVRLPPERGATLADNALLKARAAASATREPSIADDSGIEVAALGGAPGIRSARYAGLEASDEENLEKLLRDMAGIADRRAAYVCALALVVPGAKEQVFEARCEGRIAERPSGSGGFGYDPIFIPDELVSKRARTMAELSPGQKDVLSHRGRAVRLLLEWLSSCE